MIKEGRSLKKRLPRGCPLQAVPLIITLKLQAPRHLRIYINIRTRRKFKPNAKYYVMVSKYIYFLLLKRYDFTD